MTGLLTSFAIVVVFFAGALVGYLYSRSYHHTIGWTYGYQDGFSAGAAFERRLSTKVVT
jgi:hypothetical protein